MVDINKLVESYHNSSNLKVDNLFQLIAEQMKLFEDALPGGPQTDDKTFEAWFPRPRITENFGNFSFESTPMLAQQEFISVLP